VKNIIFILFLLPFTIFGQQVADREFYLLDDLVLEDLTENDRLILDSCLNSFSLAKDDTSKIIALNFICDNLVSDVWSDYQIIQYKLIEDVLQGVITEKERNVIELIKGGSLNNLGLYYEFQVGNTSKALEFYLKALTLFEKLKDEMGKAMMLNRIGTIYTSQDNIEKGFEYYQQSLSIYQKLNEHQQISNPLNNLGSYYKDKEDYSTALNYYEQSLLIDIKNKNQQGIATVQSNIGGIYVVQEKYSQALIVFIKGLKISEELGDKNLIALLLNNIGQIYYLQGDYKSAYFNVSSALKIAKEANYLGRINASSFLLSQIYNAQKDPENALKMYKIYTYTKDSMTNKSIKIDAIKQQSKYEYEKQKAVDDAINDKQKQKQEIITYAIGFGLTLVLIFLIFVFNRLQVTRKQKIIIEGAHKELSEKNKEILDSITYAKRIQNAILPTDNLVKELLKNSFVLYKPKDIVAGDFYWVKTLPTGEIIFSVADCTGHGVPGAMVSMVCNNALNRSIKEYGLTNLGEILDKTREIVIEEFSLEGDVENKEDYVKDGMDIALCSLQGDTLQYAGANNPLWIVREGEVIITKANKQPIGSFRSSEPFIVHTIELQKEDVIYIFSDGYADQFGGEKGKKFMAKAFRKLLISIQEKTMSEQQKILNDSFESWRGSLEQVDDVCIIGVRI